MVLEEGEEPCGGLVRGEPADGVGDLAEFAVEGVAVVGEVVGTGEMEADKDEVKEEEDEGVQERESEVT